MNHVLSLESMERYESHAAASYGYHKMKFSLNRSVRCFILYTQGVFPSQNSSFRCVGYITHMLIYLFGGGGGVTIHMFMLFLLRGGLLYIRLLVFRGVTKHMFTLFFVGG